MYLPSPWLDRISQCRWRVIPPLAWGWNLLNCFFFFFFFWQWHSEPRGSDTRSPLQNLHVGHIYLSCGLLPLTSTTIFDTGHQYFPPKASKGPFCSTWLARNLSTHQEKMVAETYVRAHDLREYPTLFGQRWNGKSLPYLHTSRDGGLLATITGSRNPQ